MTTYIIKILGSRKDWNRLLESSRISTAEINLTKQELKLATLERTKEMVEMEMIEGRGVEFILIHPDPYPSPEE